MLQPANNTNPYRRTSSRLTNLGLILIWLTILGVLTVNRQSIIDWWRLRGYQAPATVASLASQDTMTSYARRLFYINRPSIEASTQFRQHCPDNGGEQTIVLGCYHGNQSGIILLSVTDQRLDGVEQVTAAHEMLHGAYERLGSAEKSRIDAMLIDYYQHGLQDQRVKDTIAAYRKSEPNDLVNEMHSVFATEVAHLPSGLEHYYERYFDNRAQVAAFAAQYQSEFTSRQAVVAQDDARLADLKQRIDNLEADLQAKQADITSSQTALNTLRANGDIEAYNSGVPAYNRLIDAYNAEVYQIRSLIAQYNALVDSRNAVALEENQLAKELSGSPATISR